MQFHPAILCNLKSAMTGLSCVELSAGNSYTCGVTAAHVAYCWGLNGDGALGVGTTTGPEICSSGDQCSASPVAVSGGLSITNINAATFHTCAITAAGKAYGWGENFAGQLGNRTTDPDAIPIPVSRGLTFSQLTTGIAHTCGVTSAHTAYGWGAGGRLGNGRHSHESQPSGLLGVQLLRSARQRVDEDSPIPVVVGGH